MLFDIGDCLTAPAGVLTPYAPTAEGANINTASYIDRLIPMDDGSGAIIVFLTYITTAFASSGSATVDFQLLGNATDPTFSSGNVLLTGSGAIAVATLVKGYRVTAKPIPRQPFLEYEAIGTPLRYFALNLQIATAVLTAGACNSWLKPNDGIQDNLSYAAGYSVLG